MSYFLMLLIGVGLSLNVLGISVSQGAVLAKIKGSKLFEMGIILAIWQLVAFAIGFFVINLPGASSPFEQEPEFWKLVSAVILFGIAGIKIIEISVGKNGEERAAEIDFKKIFIFAAVNSIYAFFAGFACGLLNFHAFITAGFVASMTFAVVIIGVLLGYYKGMAPRKVYTIGSYALILIGIIVIANYAHI